MDGLLQATAIFALVLAFSLLIERVLEVLKSLYDLADSHFDWYHIWTRQAKDTRAFLERRRRVFELIDPKAQAAFLNRFSDMLLQRPASGPGGIPVICGDLVRAAYVRLAMKTVGCALGMTIAFWQDLDLLKLYQESAGGPSKWIISHLSSGWREAFTGIALGLGAGPVHKIIGAIERKREEKANPASRDATAEQPTPSS